MYGIILALGVAFLKSLGELAGKYSLSHSRKTIDEYALSLGMRFYSALAITPIALYLGISAISTKTFIILIVVSILNALTTVYALKAVKHGDLSMVGPLSSLTIPFLLLTSFLITGEVPNFYGFFGIFLVFIGTYILQIKSFRDGWEAPFLSIYKNKGAKYMAFTAILWSISAPLDKLGINETGTIQWMFLTSICITVGLALYMVYRNKLSDIRSIYSLKHTKKIFAVTAAGGAATLLQMFALKYTLVVYVISIKRASGMFSVILGYLFFKEKNILQKLIAASTMFAGVLCIIVFGNI